MVQARFFLNIFAYLLALIFGILLATVSVVSHVRPAEVFLFFVLFSASVGLIFKREWGRKLVRAASMAGIVYFAIKQIFISGRIDVPSLSMMGICALIIYFYRSVPLATLYREISAGAASQTVLVVDDDMTFVKLVRSHFIKQGLNVISAESGERGIEMAKRAKPDLIILDVILPGMKGRTVCAKLKEDADTEGIPVMFVTFKNSLDDISAELELGAVMHLTKPVDYEHLYQQARRILGKG